ncbi:DNA repair protein rad2 [Tulasnella sp. 419]|nr:DNA repair protein rad2 [Tulasnella sp. 419]
MGVKQLWTLLAPVGRPVLLETMEGKVLAIDSSIWLYQFQATMRDKDGRGLVNAHILGFLRRICKLLFYGIRPVFVFDGGAPALKRSTLNERRKKKSGAAASHVKLAERLLAAQLRKEALNHASTLRPAKPRKKGQPAADYDEGAYMEDFEGPEFPGAPTRNPTHTSPKKSPSSSPDKVAAEKAKRARWQDHDPYKLPEVDMDAMMAKATSSEFPDARLATEEELRAFIEEMRPEDFDVTSEAFRELPTEVQYEIIGDLRLKSRQTSHKRLQAMLKKSATPLDFSKAQIINLKQRNNLTQQLLATTDSIGKAHLTIPVRIASERNRQYMLVKNEGKDGGWVLGVRDEGTQAKPIEVDAKSDGEESDESMEMVVPPPNKNYQRKPDPDLREYQRQMALSAIGKRYSPKKLAPLTKPVKPPKPSQPLFVEGDEDVDLPASREESPEGSDVEVLVAIQQSLELQEEADMRHALRESRKAAAEASAPSESSLSLASGSMLVDTLDVVDAGSPDMEPVVPAVSAKSAAASTSSGDEGVPMGRIAAASMLFGLPTLLMDEGKDDQQVDDSPKDRTIQKLVYISSDEDMEEVIPGLSTSNERFTFGTITAELSRPSQVSLTDDERPSEPPISRGEESDSDEFEEVVGRHESTTASITKQSFVSQLSVSTGRETVSPIVHATVAPTLPEIPPVESPPRSFTPSPKSTEVIELVDQPMAEDALSTLDQESSPPNPVVTAVTFEKEPIISDPLSFVVNRSKTQASNVALDAMGFDTFDDDNDAASGWSRSPSPTINTNQPSGDDGQNKLPQDTHFDAADEMDPEAEEGDFAKFISQVKGKDLDAAREEIDEEIRALNREKKAAMRDSEDVTQQMVAQIKVMLKLFGIPYLTAPMEAEAQCAALVELGLVEGIITDDSDVFLFGGLRVYRNMFNQSKTVECFLLSDLSRELGLDRDRLIRLAYLLGSDYVDGLPGVGPVVAMELLKDFDGEDGLIKFRDWWSKVQSGRDKAEDNNTKFRQRFKKKFKDLYLGSDWPNSSVKDAYYHPTVDQSTENFRWGLPDLDALREFLKEELGWSAAKVDETILPIIRKVGQRGQANAATRQANLNGFLDIAAGSGTAAPRQRHAYASKRLQKVVSDFRKRRGTSQARDEGSEDDISSEAGSSKKPATGAKKGKSRQIGTTKKGKQVSKKAPAKKKRKVMQSDDEEWSSGMNSQSEGISQEQIRAELPKPRPKPRRRGQASNNEAGESDSGDGVFFMRK